MSKSLAVAVTALSLAVLAIGGALALRPAGGVADRAVAGYGTVERERASSASDSAAAAPERPAPPDRSAAPASGPALRPAPRPQPSASGIPIPPRPPAPDIPVASGAISNLQADRSPAPVGLRIAGISVDALVEPVGYDARRDEMQVPRSREIVGWYRHGPAPGEAGSAVLAAHVDWNGAPGAFFLLSEVEAGDTIVVEFEDGSERRFRAAALESIAKNDLPVDDLFAKDGPAVLTLITCGGAFDDAGRSYRENVVLRAVEIPPSRSLPTA